MSDLASLLIPAPLPFSNFLGWKDVLNTFESGTVPHCWAVTAPVSWHKTLLQAMSRLYLCDVGKGDDCTGCRSWNREGLGHPDLIIAGEFDKPANVEACRSLIRELPLRPVAAKRRLGVVLAADKLLVHAANSLLKIAEEPPSHACLLFLLEGNDFLPTLRSRSRFTTLAAPISFTARPAPKNDSEWLDWLEGIGGRKEEADISEVLSSWTSSFLQEENVDFAVRAEKIRLLVLQKKLSQNMVVDLLTLTLKEELPFEHIFGGIR